MDEYQKFAADFFFGHYPPDATFEYLLNWLRSSEDDFTDDCCIVEAYVDDTWESVAREMEALHRHTVDTFAT